MPYILHVHEVGIPPAQMMHGDALQEFQYQAGRWLEEKWLDADRLPPVFHYRGAQCTFSRYQHVPVDGVPHHSFEVLVDWKDAAKEG